MTTSHARLKDILGERLLKRPVIRATMGTVISTIGWEANPSYYDVIEPLLRAHGGDASALLQAYPNFDAEGDSLHTYGVPYLHHACFRNHFHAVRGLLQGGACLLRKAEKCNGKTSLAFACSGDEESRVDMVQWLLSEHANARTTVNWTDTSGRTALWWGVYHGSTAIVKVLLFYGAISGLINVKAGGYIPGVILRVPEYHAVIAPILKAAKLAHAQVRTLVEWRPWKQAEYARGYRGAIQSLVVLAKART